MARRNKAQTDGQGVFDIDNPAPASDGIATVGIEGIADAPETTRMETAAAPKERVTVTLDAAGGLDLDSMRPKTRDKLVAALTKSHSDLFPSAPAKEIKRWPDFAVRGIYGVLGAGEAALAARKLPPEIAQQVFMYSDDEIAVLMDPTQAVLAKHAGRLDKYQEEVALALVLIQIHFAKLHALRPLMAQYEKQQADAKREKDAARAPGTGPNPLTEVQ